MGSIFKYCHMKDVDKSKISQDNPTASAREIRLATKRIFREMSSDSKEETIQHREDDLNRRLQRYFTYDGDSLELEQFKTADWDEISKKLKSGDLVITS